MRLAKRMFMGLGVTALAALIVTLVAPKAVHAAVAALVEVTNTSSNPVPNADVNASGEEPFQTFLCSAGGDLTCTNPSTFTVPATTSDGLSVKRLVIEFLSVNCTNFGGSDLRVNLTAQINENPVNGGALIGNTVLPLAPSSPGTSGYPLGSMFMRAYADPLTIVSVGVEGAFGTSSGVLCYFTVVGDFVTH
jgi:hypothetical protein